MRITGVESTELFTGSARRPLQVVRVTVEATEAGEAGAAVTVRVMGAGADTPRPFGMTLGEPGEGRTGEVSVAVTGAPGVALPVTVICETADGQAHPRRIEHGATITAAEPGWTMWMVSHFHYDPVWWTTQGQFTEARLVLPDEDGNLPDTRTAFDLVRLHLEKARRDPDYKFVLAEIDYLKPHFDAFPRDRACLRSLLRDGRVELVGGTYNEPNTNLTGAETTIRNAVYGMGFQRGVLGAEPASAWMLDAFGFDPGFPGLMAAAGLTSSSWARGPFHQWGPEENTRMQFPAEFEWLSPDGSGLLTAYMANHYGAGWMLQTAGGLDGAISAAYDQFRSLAPVAATPNVLLPVGSDHVIPARWVTDVGREWSKRYVWPRFVPAIPREFFAAVRSAVAAEPSRYWIMPQTRDMNPLYTGKDVSYADTKLAHRAGETAVLEGERLSTLAWLRGAPYPAESLDRAWRLLAYGAHHDAITGTESDEVYLDLLAGWREAWERGEAARRSAIAFLGGHGSPGGDRPGNGAVLAVTVANGLARERDGMATVTATLDVPGTPWLEVVDPDSATVLPALAEGVRRHGDGSLAQVTLTFRATGVPALGLRRYLLRAVPASAAGAAEWSDISGYTISNDAFTVTADPSRGGALGSVFDKRAGREVLRGPGNDLVLQEEYEQHPRWGEGPWHLSPKGPGIASSSSAAAAVRAQRCPAGSRLTVTYSLRDLATTAETILWDGADRVEFRTRISGSIGKNHLLRVRFPADLPGALPVYQTATAVIGRPFGTAETDVARHWWTLDNPAHHWFGLGSVARVVLATGAGDVPVALGVAEVIPPDQVRSERQPLIRDLLVRLAQAGVTATCSRASGSRYGSVDVDSNLPDFRIALGGPSENAFTAEVLAACDPAVAKRLAALVADAGLARLWVPAARSRAAAFGPGADLRGARDLPVLIVATADPADLEEAIAGLGRDLAHRTIPAQVDQDAALADGDAPLAEGAVAVFNRGTPGCVVTPDGTLWMSLFRACSSWPTGVWIDGDRRTAPDGSSFAWQHWSHTFSYALASAGRHRDWRGGGFNADAEDFNHEFRTSVGPHGDGSGMPGSGEAEVLDIADMSGTALVDGTSVVPVSALDANLARDYPVRSAGHVTLSALKPYGNPLAAGRPGYPSAPAAREVTVRLRETDGRPAVARLRLAAGIEGAWRAGLLEEARGEPLTIESGTALVPLLPFETATVLASVAPPPPPSGLSEPDLPDAQPAPVDPAESAIGRPAGGAEHAAGPAMHPGGALEPVQPVYTRYWLHGKGPAPTGNMPAAVHFTPPRVTLGGDPGAIRVALTVACGPEPASGTVQLVVPEGLNVRVADGAGAGAAGTVSAGEEPGGDVFGYDLPPNGFAGWDLAVSADPGTPDGRYFLAARITDRLGQVLEDAALVTIGEAGPPEADLDPDELFPRMQSDVQALAGEVDLEVPTQVLSLAPGESGELTVRVASHLRSQLRGEVQLISPIGTWRCTAPWTQPVVVEPDAETTVTFGVTVPATAERGWHSWLLVKLMYFGRVCYSQAVLLTVS